MSDTKKILFEINEELKHKFKVVCLNNRESQKDAMNRLVRHYVDKNGNLKKVQK